VGEREGESREREGYGRTADIPQRLNVKFFSVRGRKHFFQSWCLAVSRRRPLLPARITWKPVERSS
jgi:hypothetical protein